MRRRLIQNADDILLFLADDSQDPIDSSCLLNAPRQNDPVLFPEDYLNTPITWAPFYLIYRCRPVLTFLYLHSQSIEMVVKLLGVTVP